MSFLGDLVWKGNARRIYTKVVIGGRTSALAVLDSGSKIRLVNSHAFAEVARLMLILGKPLQIEPCYVSITSYTQDRSPLTRRAWVDLTFQEMTLIPPLHICHSLSVRTCWTS